MGFHQPAVSDSWDCSLLYFLSLLILKQHTFPRNRWDSGWIFSFLPELHRSMNVPRWLSGVYGAYDLTMPAMASTSASIFRDYTNLMHTFCHVESEICDKSKCSVLKHTGYKKLRKMQIFISLLFCFTDFYIPWLKLNSHVKHSIILTELITGLNM